MIEKDLVQIKVAGPHSTIATLPAPTNMSLSLMELLKGNGYPIQATCGGMALCATCHVCVLEGYEQVGEPASDAEWAMLDSLFNLTDTSRLACQVRIGHECNNILVKILGDK